MHLTPTFENGVAYVLYHPWQFVGADMRMRVSQNGSGCPMLAKHIQYLVYTAPLLASGVEFAVGIGTGTSFPETIVALAIHFLCFGDERKVFLALSHILSTLYHNGTKPLLYQPQGGKQSAGAGSHHNDRLPVPHIGIVGMHILVVLWQFIDIGTHLQIDENGALAGIHTFLQHTDMLECAYIQSFLLGEMLFDTFFLVCHLRQYSKLIFFYHDWLLVLLVLFHLM